MRSTFGASGTLRDRIAAGERAEVFASANMTHPQSLAGAGKSGPVVLFARNRLCALVRPGLAVTPATLLDQMLSPGVKVGTSTPKADPSGDYAFEVFAKADALKAGAGRAGERRRCKLSGARTARGRRTGRNSTAGTSPRAARTSSSPTVPPRPWRSAKIPVSRSSPCPKRSRSVQTTGSPS